MNDSEMRRILRYGPGGSEEAEDLVASETLLEVFVNGRRAAGLMCTPSMLRELAVGFVMSEGIAEGLCIERVSLVSQDGGFRVEMHAEGEVRLEGGAVSSGCAGGITFSVARPAPAVEDSATVEAAVLFSVMKELLTREGLYASTGCAHRTALADGGGIVCFAEDIGRHNALDKVIGSAILDREGFAGRMMFSSGRLSSDMVSKCAAVGVPIIASRGAPTSKAVDIAEAACITLVGFLRGSRFNIYTRPERISS